ncbi:MAG: LPS assembly protein LptD [Alphaproteobacteria bacterium]|nr:LPS assembly protein LptD [Alphaproteobacteria bacterium]
MIKRYFFIGAFIFVGTLVPAFAVKSEEFDSNLPINYSADEVVYNKETGQIILNENVYLKYGNNEFKAKYVNYDTVNKTISANGNVEIKTIDNDIIRAEKVLITEKNKPDEIGNQNNKKNDSDKMNGVRYIMFDKSIATAASATHEKDEEGQDVTNFYDVDYSTCDYCINGFPIEDESTYTNSQLEELDRFWHIKASRLEHNKDEKQMYVYHSKLYMKEMPLLYIPYFSYPDPTVKRKTGFLMPSYKSNSKLGKGVIVPYYIEVDDNTDITYRPWIAEKGVLHAGDFRHKFKDASLAFEGSKYKDMYNYKVDFDWKMTDVWRFQVNGDRVSDDTYMRLYDIRDDGENWLTSEVKAEALASDYYVYLGATEYRDMRKDVEDDSIPKVLPEIKMQKYLTPFDNNGYFTLAASSAELRRKDSFIGLTKKSNRVSTELAYHYPGVSNWGLAYEVGTSHIFNIYRINEYRKDPEDSFTGNATSESSQASLMLSYPLVNVQDNYSVIFEPMVMGVAAPNSSQNKNIPNEESNEIDMTDIALFSERRYVANDRIEPGSRVDYGFKTSINGENGTSLSLMFGQSYRFSDREEFSWTSGLHDHYSDYVGRATLNLNGWANIGYSFRIDKDNHKLARSDTHFSVGNPLLRFSASYIYLKNKIDKDRYAKDQEEINYTVSSQLSRFWSTSLNQRYNLKKDSKDYGMTDMTWAIRYEDECFAWIGSVKREYNVHDKDGTTKKETTIEMGIELKPYGAFNVM